MVKPYVIRSCLLIDIKRTNPKWIKEPINEINQGVYREKQLRSKFHLTWPNYNDNYIAIKPLVLKSPKMQDLQERQVFKSPLLTY